MDRRKQRKFLSLEQSKFLNNTQFGMKSMHIDLNKLYIMCYIQYRYLFKLNNIHLCTNCKPLNSWPNNLYNLPLYKCMNGNNLKLRLEKVDIQYMFQFDCSLIYQLYNFVKQSYKYIQQSMKGNQSACFKRKYYRSSRTTKHTSNCPKLACILSCRPYMKLKQCRFCNL